MKRALRRDQARVKQAARVKAHFHWLPTPVWRAFYIEITPSKAGMYRNHSTLCSCPRCGNPRRHFGQRTLQELRHMQEPLPRCR